MPIDVVARLSSRRFGGFESLQLDVRDVAPAGTLRSAHGGRSDRLRRRTRPADLARSEHARPGAAGRCRGRADGGHSMSRGRQAQPAPPPPGRQPPQNGAPQGRRSSSGVPIAALASIVGLLADRARQRFRHVHLRLPGSQRPGTAGDPRVRADRATDHRPRAAHGQPCHRHRRRPTSVPTSAARSCSRAAATSGPRRAST